MRHISKRIHVLTSSYYSLFLQLFLAVCCTRGRASPSLNERWKGKKKKDSGRWQSLVVTTWAVDLSAGSCSISGSIRWLDCLWSINCFWWCHISCDNTSIMVVAAVEWCIASVIVSIVLLWSFFQVNSVFPESCSIWCLDAIASWPIRTVYDCCGRPSYCG